MSDTSTAKNVPGMSYPCHECQAGMVKLRFVTFFTWLGDELITVPNFPAWVCDVCGRREYDDRAVNWLSALLNPDAGHPTRHLKTPERSGPKHNLPRASTES
jgi:YgiT-type zinc finger domain-containing protein